MRSAGNGWIRGPVHGNYNRAAILLHASCPGVQKEPDVFIFKRPLKFRRNFRILTRNDLLSRVNYGHATSESREHLSELEANVSPAQNNQMFGNHGQIHNILVRQIRHPSQSWNVGNAPAATGINEDFFGLQESLSHLNLVGGYKSGMAAVEMQIGTLLHLLFFSATKTVNNFILLVDNRLQVGAYVRCANAPTLRVSRVVGHLRAMDHGLCG